MIEDRTNLVAAGSGGGYGHQSCPAGVPVELALLSILAAFGVAFGVLFTALTQITGRRRKRSVDLVEELTPVRTEVDPIFKFADILLFGEFYQIRSLGASPWKIAKTKKTRAVVTLNTNLCP